MLSEFLFETLETFGVFGDRPDIFLKDDLLHRCGTDHLTQPPKVGRIPGGLARIADVLPQEKRLEPKLGGLEIAYSILPRLAQIANGFIFHGGDVDGCKVPQAHQPGQFDGVSTLGFDPIPGLLGD
jgi:hypothetical protein